MKVYVVTSECGEDCGGEDRHIEYIFSTREKAEEWIGPMRWAYQVEERIIDDPTMGRPTLVYHTRIDIESDREWSTTFHELREQSFQGCAKVIEDTYRQPYRLRYIDGYSPASAEHARELADAARLEWLRARELMEADPDTRRNNYGMPTRDYSI